MKKPRIIQKTEQFVRRRLATEGTGHDWWHIARVVRNARLICKSEKADWLVVELAALLHDVGDRKVIQKDEDDHSIAEKFLKGQGADPVVIDRVMHIIKNMSFSKSLRQKKSSEPIEFQIVQDADRLDAMGAIGVARAFAYGGRAERLLYDPTENARAFHSTKTYRNLKSSSLHHFEEKLFHLKDLMNTGAARKIARARHRYMKEYHRQFLAEWNGRK